MGDTPSTDLPIGLRELLCDPLIQLVMKADKVDAAAIHSLYHRLSAADSAAGALSPEGAMSIYPVENEEYRSGVGIMLMNARNEVFVGRRLRTAEEAWQMPQGGINDGENPRAAALRELREEIGTDNVEILAESRGWLRYDLPPDLVAMAWAGRWRGQQQKWFAMRFLGSDQEIDIGTEHPEFLAWRWVEATHLPSLIVAFKRELYRDVLREFEAIHVSEAK